MTGSLTNLAFYFLRLGASGFGGPIVLTAHMRRDLVEERKWLSDDDYREGLALAQLAPGPLAAQLAIYIGWVKGRVWGATLIGFAFVLPSFLMVLVIAALYLRYGGLPWIQGLFYGIGAAVIGIIAQSANKLVGKTLGKDYLLWVLGAVSAAITVWTESEIFWVFVVAGIIPVLLRTPPKFSSPRMLLTLFPLSLFTGLHGAASKETLLNILLFFSKSGAVVFGSGLAIVPFLHGGVVQKYQWLTERQFIDAVAVAMITPGPVVITVAFIGFLVAGLVGAILAALGTFLPCYLFVILPAPYFRRIAQIKQIKAFVDGVTAAAVGAIAGAAVVLGKRAVIDMPTALIAIGCFLMLLKTKKIPEPVLIVISGGIGLLLKGGVQQ